MSSKKPTKKKKKTKASRPSPKNDPPANALRYTYDIAKILQKRDALVEVLEFEYLDRVVEGKEFERLLRIVAEGLGGKIHPQTLEDSVRCLAGVRLTKDLISDACHRLAGNMPRLRHRRVVAEWSTQRAPEWAPVHIMAARPGRDAKNNLGATFMFKFLAGTACPMLVLQWWSMAKCRFVAHRFGFSRFRGTAENPSKYVFTRVEQFVMLRFLGLIDPALSEREPVISHIDFSPSIDAWNKQKIKERFRVDPGYNCPRGYPRQYVCHLCPVGYADCPAGTHRLTYEKKVCAECKQDAYFDDELSRIKCVNCYNREVFRRTR